MGTRVTQAQIARLTGVCQSTVSLVLSGRQDASVQPETRERVLAIARELGYNKNIQDKPKRQRTGIIGFLVPAECNTENGRTYEISRLHNGIVQGIAGLDYQANLAYVGNTNVEELPELVRQERFDGVIVFDSCNAQWLRRIAKIMPVVRLHAHDRLMPNGSAPLMTPIDSVMPENIGGMYLAMRHLYDLGHRRIAVFGASKFGSMASERLEGYRQSLRALNLPTREEYFALSREKWQHSKEDSQVVLPERLGHLLQLPEPPTAVFALSDYDAALLIRTARTVGVAIPEQLSVVGIDDMVFSECLHPPLTTVHKPLEEMGQEAVRILLEHIHGITRPACAVRMQMSLMVRGTTAPPAVAVAGKTREYALT